MRFSTYGLLKPPKCRWFGRSPVVPYLGVVFSISTGAGQVILRLFRSSVFLHGNNMCTTFIELKCFLTSWTNWSTCACLFTSLHGKKTLASQWLRKCVCWLCSSALKRPSCFDVSKNGDIGSTARRRKKIVASQTWVVFGLNVISKSWQTTWRYEATGVRK